MQKGRTIIFYAQKIQFIRLLLLIFGIVFIIWFSKFLIDDVIEGILDIDLFKSDDDYIKTSIGGIFLTIAGYGLKRLIVDDIDDLFSYVSKLTILDEIKQLINNRKIQDQNGLYELEGFNLIDYSKFISFFFLILSIPVGLLSFKEFILNDKNKTEQRPIYAFSIGETQVIQDDISSFKLYLTFEDSITTLDSNSDEAQLNLLQNTILSTSSCINESKDTLGFNIIGYASSPGSQDANVSIANNRGQFIESEIKRIINQNAHLSQYKDNILIDVKKWKPNEYSSMKRTIYTEPTNPTTDQLGRSSSAEYLNRRVEVSILRIGDCKPNSEKDS